MITVEGYNTGVEWFLYVDSTSKKDMTVCLIEISE